MSVGTSWPLILGFAAFGYLLGSIPFGLILTRMAGLGDVRAIGSGNIGATNVLRTGNKAIAAATLLGDMLKGTAAVLIAARWGGEPAMAAAFGAFIGHLFPIWLGFKGGKGVATYIGVLLGLAPLAALGFVVVWLAVALATKYSSLSALLASLSTPLVLWFMGHAAIAALFVALTAIVFLKHAQNIRRLLAGSESRIGQKS